MPAKMMKLMPLPMPFSVISSPSHIRAIEPAVRVAIWVRVAPLARSKPHDRIPCELSRARKPYDWRRAIGHGQVAGVLVDLVATVFALALSAWSDGITPAHQLHDDRGVDVRVHAECDDREARQAAAGQEVQHAEQGVVLEVLRELRLVDARDRHMGQEPEDDQDPEDDTGSGAGCPARGRRSAASRTRARRPSSGVAVRSPRRVGSAVRMRPSAAVGSASAVGRPRARPACR